MIYHPNILVQKEFIDAIFIENGLQPLLSNKSIRIDEYSNDKYLKLHFKQIDCIEFELILSMFDLELSIDRVRESLAISFDSFKNNTKVIREYIEILIRSKIILEYCGDNYTKIIFYNNDGLCIKTIRYGVGFFLFWRNCIKTTFRPIVDQPEM